MPHDSKRRRAMAALTKGGGIALMAALAGVTMKMMRQ
jgi:hypothetical protein